MMHHGVPIQALGMDVVEASAGFGRRSISIGLVVLGTDGNSIIAWLQWIVGWRFSACSPAIRRGCIG
jgi:hypothetical protein